MSNLDELNVMPEARAREILSSFCGSRTWQNKVFGWRPFRNANELILLSARAFSELEPPDWLEAFTAHPRIGGTRAQAPATKLSQQWSIGEQAQVGTATADVQEQLRVANDAYFDKFGIIFIICASGRSPEEMLAELTRRLGNDRSMEFQLAAKEQAQITQVRIRNWCGPRA